MIKATRIIRIEIREIGENKINVVLKEFPGSLLKEFSQIKCEIILQTLDDLEAKLNIMDL